MPNVYPEFDSSNHNYLATLSYRSRAVYLAAILGILLLLACLPLVRVNVTAQAPGTLRPFAEKTEVRPLVAGTVTKLLVHENQTVHAGDTLLTLQSGTMQAQFALNTRQQAEQLAFVQDLEWLVRHLTAPASGLHTQLYGQQAAQYHTQVEQLGSQLQKSARDMATSQTLFEDKVIARVEMEDKVFAHRKRLDEVHVLTETQRSQWQADLASHRATLTELRGRQQQLNQEQRLYCLKAPVTGTVQQLAGKYAGSYLQSGELLGTISPDGELLAECYVSPKDIGYMRVGMPARFQVDAFDYNQWGLVEGRITDIARDFVLQDKDPVFKVRCHLSRSFLQLDNGYRGTLRKSMTVHARFMLARRSLWQLLFDRADNWLNPTQNGAS